MTVQQLIEALQKQDPSALVGVSATYVHGWVQNVRGLALSPKGVVCLDQTDESLCDDEESLQKV
jgi:hypothetical protein